MRKILRTLLLWTLILGACSTGRLSPEALSSNRATNTSSPSIIPSSTTEPPPLTQLIPTIAAPDNDQPPDGNATTAAPAFEGCAYQWAYQDLPKPSSGFQRAIQELQAEAQARAFAFGENCVRADGSADFIPMETDFDVTLQIADLSNEAQLGEWIVKVMQVIESIPGEEIVGPRPGRVSIEFQSASGQQFARFYIDQYRLLPPGLSPAQVYQALQTPQ